MQEKELTLPGFVDLHVHLREPGDNKAETIANGARTAMLGGFVLVCDMPNNPGRPTRSVDRLREKIDIAEDAIIPVRFYSGSQPESNNLEELEEMSSLSVGLKLYGAPTTGNLNKYSASDFKRIVSEWHRVASDKPIMLHAENDNLEGFIDLVAERYKHPLHICHVVDPAEVVLRNRARSRGLDVTCGATPHAIFMSSHDIMGKGPLAIMQPPLPTQLKSRALWEMIKQADVDAIESDYAPHTIEAKLKSEKENPTVDSEDHGSVCYGVTGIENHGSMFLRQYTQREISLERLVDAMHTKPLEILRIESTPDTAVEWDLETFIIGEKDVYSGSKMSPYIGYLGAGKVAKVTLEGKVIYTAT